VQERHWSGPPQSDGPIALRLPPFGFVLQLHLRLSALEGIDLSMELVVELPQCILFAYGILAVESRLLPIAIWPGLLLLHLLFYVGEHLKDLAFE